MDPESDRDCFDAVADVCGPIWRTVRPIVVIGLIIWAIAMIYYL